MITLKRFIKYFIKMLRARLPYALGVGFGNLVFGVG